MKKLFLSFFLFFGLNALAGGFIFPNVTYSYAKLYLFNVDLGQPNHMDFRIYKDKVYAQSKLGNGWELSPEFHEKMGKALAHGIDELIIGLGKCFMPRHGIIYYDAEHNPVASFSICFECDKISVWTEDKYDFSEDYSSFDYDKAEKQMEDLAKIIRAEDLPVYTSSKDEQKYFLALARDTNFFKASAKLVYPEHELDGLPSTITEDLIKSWPVDKKKFHTGKDTIDARTQKPLTLLKYSKESQFLFDQKELHFAYVSDANFLFPNGTSIGMSVAEVYRRFGYEDPADGAYPTRLNLMGTDWNMQFEFKHQTLVAIMLHPAP